MSDSIIYSLVARGNQVLAEKALKSGNFLNITRRILEKIPKTDNKMTYTYDRYAFHYWVEKGLVYLCMSTENFSRRIAFGFLKEIKTRFLSTYPSVLTSEATFLCDDFSRVLEQQMRYYSSDPSADQVRKVKGEIDEVKSVMVSNIEKVLERGERIELLVDKTENLESSAVQFKTSSTALKRSMWWKNIKLTIALVVVVLIVVYFIVAIACGGLLLPKCT